MKQAHETASYKTQPLHKNNKSKRISTLLPTDSFDELLKSELKDPQFAADFKEAGERLDVALQLARLRIKSGKTQAELARELNVSQQVISRMESPRHQNHSLQTIIRIAEALGGKVSLTIA